MANFQPLKQYMFFCLEKIIHRYALRPPFLDAGCGVGDVSLFLAKRGWDGTAIDDSTEAIKISSSLLSLYPYVHVKKESIFNTKGLYNTIMLFDCLEHIENDQYLLKKISELLCPNGFLLISVPTNPSEWRWDDEEYGHYRRYTKHDLEKKIICAGLAPVLWWDFTFPFFWMMRRFAVLFLKNSPSLLKNKGEQTLRSSYTHPWLLRTNGFFFSNGFFVWRWIYWIQFTFFKKNISRGHEMFVLAKKIYPNV